MNTKNQTLSILFVITLITSMLFVAFSINTVNAKVKVLDISIVGESKLGVDEAGHYTAYVDGVLDPDATYSWSITPDDDKIVFAPNGYYCTIKFKTATLEPYHLTVLVEKDGISGTEVFTVTDPVSLPTHYISVSNAPYNYMIAPDNTGWYYVVNGTTGQVVASGINSTALEVSTYAYGDGLVILNQIQHATSATIPAGVTVIELYEDDTEYFGSAFTFNGAVYATSFNATTFYVGSTNVTGNMLTGGTTWQGDWNATVAELIGNAAITWGQITNANATIQQLVALYESTAWLGAWNATVTDIIGDTAITWSQITSADTTVNNLITAYFVSANITAGNFASTQPMGDYTYMIYVDPTNSSLYNAKHANGTICYSSTNATSLFNSVIDSYRNIYVDIGTYNLNGSIIETEDNVTLTFANGAKLRVGDDMNNPAIVGVSCKNWIITGVSLDGNSVNQPAAYLYGPSGIDFESSYNCLVQNAYVYDVKNFGFVTGSTTFCGVINSKFTNCGANGIQLGIDSGRYSVGDYAFNNEVEYSTDVGITIFGTRSNIQQNYVHDMNGTTGFTGPVGSRWGIAVEGGGNCTISGNTIETSTQGISITAGANSNIISKNRLIDNTYTMIVSSGYNNIEGNFITAGNQGISIVAGDDTGHNNIVGNHIDVVERAIVLQQHNNRVEGNYLRDYNTPDGGYAAIDDSDALNSIISQPEMNPANLGNGSVIGKPISVTVSQAVSVGQLLFQNSSGWFLSSATSNTTMLVQAITIEAVASGKPCMVITNGFMRMDNWATMTVGATNILYASTTAGNMTQTAPSGSGNVIQDIGRVVGSKTINFFNNGAWGTHV